MIKEYKSLPLDGDQTAALMKGNTHGGKVQDL